jgi:hypothetical protein
MKLSRKRLAATLLSLSHVQAGAVEDLTGYDDHNSETAYLAACEAKSYFHDLWCKRYGDDANWSEEFGDFGHSDPTV